MFLRFITHPDFDPDIVKKVSNACEGLCKWVRAIEIYDRVIKIVRPKKIKLAKAEEDFAHQMEKLNEKRTQLTEVKYFFNYLTSCSVLAKLNSSERS